MTVVPEIETPGHAQAAIAAYPELGVTGEQLDVWTRWGINDNVLNVEESTIDFFRNVLDEVMEIFPSPFIGIGGDECPKTQWESSPRVQERMRELGVADGEALQSWFVRRLDAHLTARGRRLFGWDEILEGGLAPGATVASWRGMYGAVAAARKGHDVVACPDDQVYLDYRQSELPSEPIPVSIPLTLQDAYGFDPVPAELSADEAAHILGGAVQHLDRAHGLAAGHRLHGVPSAVRVRRGDLVIRAGRLRRVPHAARPASATARRDRCRVPPGQWAAALAGAPRHRRSAGDAGRAGRLLR